MNNLTGKYHYDYTEDIFSVYMTDTAYDVSFDVGNFIFDLDKERRIIGVVILNASQELHIEKEVLRAVSAGTLHVNVTKTVIRVELDLDYTLRNAVKEKKVLVERVNDEHLQPSNVAVALA